MSKRKHGPTIVPALSAKVDNKGKRFIQVGNSLLLSKQFHAFSTGSRFLYFCMAMESGGRKNFILPQKDAKMAHGVNPRSRLIRFSKNSSFHYFTVDEMGLRLMKLALDEMALYRFQRYLQQNDICKASTERKYASCRRACSSRGTADRTNARCHNGGCHRGAAAGH